MQLAGVFASFGTKVTMLTSAARVLDMLDEELAAAAVAGLGGLGVRFVTGCRFEGASGSEGALTAHLTDASGQPHTIEAQRVLLAVGRRPDVTGLDLEAAGVELDRGRVVHDTFMRTSNPSIWVAGDAAGGMMQTPVANMEGRTVAASIISGTPTAPDCSVVPVTAFTVPELATVGLTEAQARETYDDVVVSRVPFDELGQAIVSDERHGFVKLVATEPGHVIVGAQIAAPGAADLIYSAAIALRAGWTLEDIGSLPAVHPSFAEALYYAGR